MINNACYINGQWIFGRGKEFTSINPADSSIEWRGRGADPDQVIEAAQAARDALDAWMDSGYEKRAEIVRRYAELLKDNTQELAEMISREMGKPLWDSLTEVGAMVGKIALSEKSYQQRTGFQFNKGESFNSVLRHKAHGVVAVYGPYNFPGHLPNGHIVPALLAGNTVLFKPSEITPKIGEMMMALWEKAGLPMGVLNLVQGEKEVGIALASADINGLFFTGSSQVGKILHRHFAGRPEVNLALEMGGNNPLIVSNVSDIEAACYHIIQSAFITSGQRCTCARRLILPDGDEKADALLARLVQMAKELRVGLWSDEQEPYMGPVVSGDVANHFLSVVDDLVERGAGPLLMPMQLRDVDALVTPAIIDVTDVSDIEDEEVFAPLLQVYRVKDFDAAIATANNTKYGLSAGVISDNRALYERYLSRSRAGIINFNRQTTGASGAAPFGGIGASGNHRPSAFYAPDYCAYPIASVESEEVVTPTQLPQGFSKDN
ncbi:MAG TPA: succinylglutamate-semialdehyde dehydrogenase [Candidatus Thioglobus sp.]|jgi:succinylglutamic semialdehyde dehydrogenase|nr:succinylglutamate-semialdehyde dehydrogenase [Candidatus Thioglobus sp.]